MVPDLPVVLWCASRRAFCSPAFPALAALAGRILADSYYIPEAFSALGVADLSWTRLTPWRAQLAQIFAHRPDRGVASWSLTIQHNGPRPPAALLFAGWVASRVSLERLVFQSTGDSPAGDLVSFEFREPAARVSLPPRGELLLLGEELSIQAPDPIYQQSRAEALRLAEIHP
jgi:glucose-6-phosphate dehydrogenase assembly protein OpcA